MNAELADVVPLSVVQDLGAAGPVAELRALTARLSEVAEALDTALVDAEIDAVAARVASVEAVAAEHLAARHAADERQAGMAAEEAAEVAETLATTAARDRDRAIAEAAVHAARALEMQARTASELERMGTLVEAERGARVAAQGHIGAVTGERDRLVAQVAALSAELAGLRAVTATPAVPTRDTAGAPRSRAPRRPRVHRPVVG